MCRRSAGSQVEHAVLGVEQVRVGVELVHGHGQRQQVPSELQQPFDPVVALALVNVGQQLLLPLPVKVRQIPVGRLDDLHGGADRLAVRVARPPRAVPQVPTDAVHVPQPMLLAVGEPLGEPELPAVLLRPVPAGKRNKLNRPPLVNRRRRRDRRT